MKQHIWNAARDTMRYDLVFLLSIYSLVVDFPRSNILLKISRSEWTGQQLAECSLYGVRVYKEGAVLATHVDRLPLVSSAIINVDQDGAFECR